MIIYIIIISIATIIIIIKGKILHINIVNVTIVHIIIRYGTQNALTALYHSRSQRKFVAIDIRLSVFSFWIANGRWIVKKIGTGKS